MYKLLMYLCLVLALSSCTIPVYVTPTDPTPTTPTVPTEPIEDTDPPPPVESGGGSQPPEEPDEGPVFNDPPDLIPSATFDLIASPRGNGDCLTIQTSCTLEKASSLLKPGQTLMLRGGVYEAGTKLETTGGGPIVTTITAFPNEVPVIDGSTNPQVPGLSLIGDNYSVSNLHFRYNWTGLYLEGNSSVVQNITAYANRVEGISVAGTRNVVRYSDANNNGTGIKVDGAIPIIMGNSMRANDQAMLVNATDAITEYNLAVDNKQGFILAEGVVRFNVSMYNGTGFLTVAGSLVYNNTVIGGQQSFVSSTTTGQVPTSFVYNLTYDTPEPILNLDSNLNNSWQLGITDPQFITLDTDSPLFARLSPLSPALNVPDVEGVPISDRRGYLGAFGTP